MQDFLSGFLEMDEILDQEEQTSDLVSIVLKKYVEELVGTRYVPLKAKGDEEYTGDEDEAVDFPYIEDPEPFVTHRPMESKLRREQGEEVPPQPGAEGMPPEGAEGVPPEGMVPGMEQEEPLSADEIGRVYELKKIYSRMTSIESYLSGTSDQSLIEVRKNVSKAIDLFEVVITNFSEFKPKVDDIIVNYYKFVEQVYKMVRDYYKDAADKDNQNESLVLSQGPKSKKSEKAKDILKKYKKTIRGDKK